MAALADEWIEPVHHVVIAKNGMYLVRIIPGESWGDAVGFEGSKKGVYARGEFYEKQADRSFKLIADVALQNPVDPVDVLLSEQGYLITFDNWHNAGYGKVVAIYKWSGALLRSYELETLYPANRVEEIPHTVSSRHWRSQNYGFLPKSNASKAYVYDYRGGLFLFDLSTGGYEYFEGGQLELMERMKH